MEDPQRGASWRMPGIPHRMCDPGHPPCHVRSPYALSACCTTRRRKGWGLIRNWAPHPGGPGQATSAKQHFAEEWRRGGTRDVPGAHPPRTRFASVGNHRPLDPDREPRPFFCDNSHASTGSARLFVPTDDHPPVVDKVLAGHQARAAWAGICKQRSTRDAKCTYLTARFHFDRPHVPYTFGQHRRTLRSAAMMGRCESRHSTSSEDFPSNG